MNEYMEQAMAVRPIMEKAVVSLDDADAEVVVSFFPAWMPGTSYQVNDRVKYNGLLYRCVQAHTSQPDWTPDAAVSLWSRTADPAEEWPEWIQPTGGHDAYAMGDKVSHKDKHWISNINANVYEPGVYGWNEA